MKNLVVYSSRTGNTKKLAEAIFEVMPDGTDIYRVEDAPSAEGYDFITVGYWVDRATADSKAKDYLETIEGKKVALFGTLGASPDSEHGRESRENAKALVSDKNEVIGDFLCQGRIDPAITEKLKSLPEGHPHGMTEERMKRHLEAAKHPNIDDFNNAQERFKEIIKQL